jgi:penicillin amidase
MALKRILRSVGKVLLIGIPSLILILVLIAAWLVRRSWPQESGKVTVQGLSAPVEVVRDGWGVPHLYAKNADDLFFAQGFVAAQDRLFQIDWWRRLGVGETAEVLGEEGVEADRFARLIRYRGDMDAEWASYSPDARKIATAFTNGINACIDQMGDRLPVEFQLLKYRPKKWKPEDVLGRTSGVYMTQNMTREVARAQLVAWDERFSTAAAERAMIEADASRAERKRHIDAVAAQFILQGWLDSRRERDT